MADILAEETKLYGEALTRMRKAHEAGRGCRLTAEMLQAMSVTLIGEWWVAVNEDGSSRL